MTTSTSLNEWAQEMVAYLIKEERWDELQEIQNAISYHDKYNKLLAFKPYDYQLRFMKAGTRYKQRMMRAANQSG